MARLEDLRKGATIRGLALNQTVTIVDTKPYGRDIVQVVYRDQSGNVSTELVFRNREDSLEIVGPGQAWNLDTDGHLIRLVSEALRIRLAHLFDPMVAVHTSLIEPLPHQITAVYGEMLTRQPLRFLLADDPGSGKTIMALSLIHI